MVMVMARAIYTSPVQLQFSPFSSSTILLSLKPPTPNPLFSRSTQFHSLLWTKEEVTLTQLTRAPMASSTPITETGANRFSVLFVCLGNICRSPAAEGVFTGLVKSRGLDSKFKVDSAGTIGYHLGDQADQRMRAAAKNRGIEITSLSRPIQPSDFKDFDLILAMDRQNKDDILGALERWKFRETLPTDAHKKVQLMCSYCKKHDESEVPDPYYGGPQGFEKVLDLLEDACESLLDSILAEHTTILDS